MKNVCIIGMGKFGHHLCQNMVKLGNQVMIVDKDEKIMEDLIPIVSSAQIGDCTNEEVLKGLGIRNFDIVFVCMGENFQSSLEITSLVKELGAKWVISKASTDIQSKFLLRNGADEVVYPDKDIAEKLAKKSSANRVFDYIELDMENSIYEIPPMNAWIGKSIKESNIRAKFGVTILGIKKNERPMLSPSPEHVIEEEEHLLVMGAEDKIKVLLKKI